jgi:hypothetical protein
MANRNPPYGDPCTVRTLEESPGLGVTLNGRLYEAAVHDDTVVLIPVTADESPAATFSTDRETLNKRLEAPDDPVNITRRTARR